MSVKIINGHELSNMPWMDRPANEINVFWRDDRNPIIKRDALPFSNSIMNSAVVPFHGSFAGVFRVDDTRRWPALYTGFSKDGVNWQFAEEPIFFEGGQVFEYGYDPRVTEIDGEYYVTWCNGYCDEPTIGIAKTSDFKTFYQFENAFLPFNRNGVLFPRKIDGKYFMLSRPSDPGHTPFGNIYVSASLDMHYWGDHRLVMKRGRGWESTKIGAGPVPIETSEGWLLIYHGALTSCCGMTYSIGAALLDLDEPWKVIARSSHYLMSPQKLYECVGDTPNVVFPCAAVADVATNRLAVYYGCADTCVGIAYSYIDEIIDHIKR